MESLPPERPTITRSPSLIISNSSMASPTFLKSTFGGWIGFRFFAFGVSCRAFFFLGIIQGTHTSSVHSTPFFSLSFFTFSEFSVSFLRFSGRFSVLMESGRGWEIFDDGFEFFEFFRFSMTVGEIWYFAKSILGISFRTMKGLFFKFSNFMTFLKRSRASEGSRNQRSSPASPWNPVDWSLSCRRTLLPEAIFSASASASVKFEQTVPCLLSTLFSLEGLNFINYLNLSTGVTIRPHNLGWVTMWNL